MQNKNFKILIFSLMGILLFAGSNVFASACGGAVNMYSYNGSVYLKTCNQRAWGSPIAVCTKSACVQTLCADENESYTAQNNITVTKSYINGNLVDTLTWSCGGTICNVRYRTDYTPCYPGTGIVVNGSCGSANGHGYNSTNDISTSEGVRCSVGTFTAFTDNGSSWSWGCAGPGGGSTATCTANKVLCGTDHTKTEKNQPTNLCQYGVANTAISLSGDTWFWTCTSNPGTDAACYTYKTTCGSDNGQVLASTPTNLCKWGSASTVSGSGPWTWTCTGTDSLTVSCSANKISSCTSFSYTDWGACQSNNMQYRTVTASYPSGCVGGNPITSQSCTMSGSCGSANKQYITSVPTATSDLCTSGISTTPIFSSESNAWVWACSGVNGGSSAGCYALKIVNGQCGPAAATYPYGSTTFNGDFCSAGTPNKPTSTLAFPVSGSSVSWVCYGINNGTNANCTASQNIAPTPESECGSEARTAHRLLTEKSSNLCKSTSFFRGFQYQSTYGPWQWYCSPNQTGTVGLVACYGYLSNNVPEITFITGASTINEKASLSLKVTATDADNDTRKYSWSCTGGKLSSTTSTVPKYTAPTVTSNTVYSCTVTVTDGFGGTATGTVDITVVNTDIACGPEAKGAHRLLTSSSSGLCVAGSATSFTGSIYGPWAWKCGTTACAASVSNSAPVIYSITPASAIIEGTNLALSVTAVDNDSGDILSYSWKCTGGTLNNSAVNNPTYTAPQVEFNTNYSCTVTVTDNFGGSATGTVTITDKDTNDCGPQTGSAHRILTSASTGLCSTVTASNFSGATYGPWTWKCLGTCNGLVANNVPIISAATGASTIKENNALSLYVTASDADGDALTYAWACTGGTLKNFTSRTTTYTAPAVDSDTVFSCTALVSDGFGGVATRSVSITVQNTDMGCGPEAKGAHRLLTSSDATKNPTKYCTAGKVTNFATKTYGPWTWKCGTSVCDASLDNSPPDISSIPSTVTVYEKTSISLSVVAVDNDVNPNTGVVDADTLTYLWTCTPSGATLKNNKTATLTFTAPSVSVDKNYSCTVKISDAYGGSITSDAVVLTVKDGTAPVIPVCTSFEYNDWGACQNGTRTRTIKSSLPAGCTGGNPILSESCTVPAPANGVCGSANGSSYLSAPSANLCADGSTPPVTLSGSSFTWNCEGKDGGSPTSCRATKTLPSWTNQ